jgi:hypothetical protein
LPINMAIAVLLRCGRVSPPRRAGLFSIAAAIGGRLKSPERRAGARPEE